MLTVEEKWTTYGLEAMERVNSKQMIWHLFLEAMRILKLKYYNSIVDHLNDLQRDPDSALLYSLMELNLDTEEVGQLLAKYHWKFACVSTRCLIHAWTVAKRTSLCDKEIWKLSKDKSVRLQYFEKIARYIFIVVIPIMTRLLQFQVYRF